MQLTCNGKKGVEACWEAADDFRCQSLIVGHQRVERQPNIPKEPGNFHFSKSQDFSSRFTRSEGLRLRESSLIV